MYSLIRDNIPELVAANNEQCNYATANTDSLFIGLLRAKLVESVEAFLATSDVAELVDVQTVLDTIVEMANVSKDDFKKAVEDKLAAQGGFTKRYIAFFNDTKKTEDTAK